MISHIQVAQENNQSVKAVHERAVALNKTYFLDVFKSAHDGKWYGALWKKSDCAACRKDECANCVEHILTLREGFNRPHEAACDLNARIDGLHLTPAEEKEFGLTNADFSLLKKLNVHPSHIENAQAFQMKKSFERALY